MRTPTNNDNKIIRKAALFLAVASMSIPALAQDYTSGLTLKGTAGETSNSRSRSTSQGQGQNSTAPKEVVYLDPDIEAPLEIDALDYELLLYENEALQIEAKKRAVAKKLYERQQLREMLEAMREDFRKEGVSNSKSAISDLTAEEIRMLRSYENEIVQAENAPLKPIEQLIRTVNVDLSSNKPIRVYVSANNQSSIVFFDRSGAPWPIVGDPIHNTEAFTTFKTGEKEHIAVFTIEKEFSESNAMINLKDLDIPIPITLVGTQSQVDARLSARIPKYGPLTEQQPTFYTKTTHQASSELLSVNNGDHVKDSLAYDIISRNNGMNIGRAYYKEGQLYIRTPYELIIPSPTEGTNMLSGYRSFIAPAREDLLFNVEGKHIEAKLTKALDLEMTKKQSMFTDEGGH